MEQTKMVMEECLVEEKEAGEILLDPQWVRFFLHEVAQSSGEEEAFPRPRNQIIPALEVRHVLD